MRQVEEAISEAIVRQNDNGWLRGRLIDVFQGFEIFEQSRGWFKKPIRVIEAREAKQLAAISIYRHYLSSRYLCRDGNVYKRTYLGEMYSTSIFDELRTYDPWSEVFVPVPIDSLSSPELVDLINGLRTL